MAKQVLELDTPFRTGERVITTRDLRGAPTGTPGKVRLVNGLSDSGGGNPWIRYWVRFNDGQFLGHIDHDDLVRPAQLDEWNARMTLREEQQNQPAVEVEEGAAASLEAPSDGGAVGLIPAALLERSRAAKARLLGG